jgi:hypothetical protein
MSHSSSSSSHKKQIFINLCDEEEDTASVWNCSACTAENEAQKLACVVCGTTQPSDEDVARALQRSDHDYLPRKKRVIEFSDEEMARALHEEGYKENKENRPRRAALSSDEEMARALQEEEDEENKQNRRRQAAADPTEEERRAPALLAAEICEQLRSAHIHEYGSVANFDHAEAFLERHARMLAASGSLSEVKILTVYHGTKRRENYSKIMDGNLKVPDGTVVLHATDTGVLRLFRCYSSTCPLVTNRSSSNSPHHYPHTTKFLLGYWGKGVYTSPNSSLALSYSGNQPVFVCLALPGRQLLASQEKHHGKPCEPGFDSHYAPGGQELIFFKSDQLFPIYLANSGQIAAATAEAKKV